MLRAVKGYENYFFLMMKGLIIMMFFFLSITGSRVPGVCGQKTPWRDGEIITLPRHVYQVSVEILILICWNFLPSSVIMCTECDMDQMDCIDISIEYLKQVLEMKVMIMAYNHIKVKIIHESQEGFLSQEMNHPILRKRNLKTKNSIKSMK